MDYRLVLLGVASLASVAGAQMPTPTPCPPCHQLGYVAIGAPLLDPPMPRVGDTVRLLFPVSHAVAGSLRCDGSGFGDSCVLYGGPPYLMGNAPGIRAPGASEIMVERQVVQAGNASVEMRVTALTEDQCYYPNGDNGCMMYFQWSYISASSGVHEIALLGVDDEGSPTPTPTATPTATASPTPTSVVNDPPVIYSAPTSIEACAATITGWGRALYCFRGGTIYTIGAPELRSQVDCDYGTFEIAVGLQPNRLNQFQVCETGGFTGGSGGCVAVEVAQTFVGDCDGDGEVTVDEIVRMIVIALVGGTESCALGDRDGDGQINVDEIVGAVDNALDGCAGIG